MLSSVPQGAHISTGIARYASDMQKKSKYLFISVSEVLLHYYLCSSLGTLVTLLMYIHKKYPTRQSNLYYRPYIHILKNFLHLVQCPTNGRHFVVLNEK